MKSLRNNCRIPGILLFCLMVGACSSIPRLDVSYVLPAGPAVSTPKEIGLEVEDARTRQNIFGPAAAGQQGGNIRVASLYVGPRVDAVTPEGIYDVPGLMREAFKRKFTAGGLKPVTGAAETSPVLVIVVKEFFLDIEKHNWTGRIAYDAKLVVDGAVKITRSIEGTGRRLNVPGRPDADILIGELFTDCVNRLDLKSLFEAAGRDLQ
jgi:hypothetical protein